MKNIEHKMKKKHSKKLSSPFTIDFRCYILLCGDGAKRRKGDVVCHPSSFRHSRHIKNALARGYDH